MEIGFHFILAALAAWRVSFLIARENGPGSVIAKFRQALGSSGKGSAMACVKCVGMWIAFPFAFFVGGTLLELGVIWLALAGVTALIDEWTKPPFEWQEGKPDELLRAESHRTSE